MVQDGICRNLAIIGEAVKKLPPTLLERGPDIEWRKIAGLRDVLVHAYASVDLGIVWDVVQNKLPGLRRAIEALRQPPPAQLIRALRPPSGACLGGAG